MIKEESIQAIRDLPITEIVGRYVKLSSRNTACCPFHNEKSASFSVSDKKGIFKCFGCGAGGDGIMFVMKMERKDFIEAVEHIANMLNVTLLYETNVDPEDYTRRREERKSDLELMNIAQDFFVKNMLSENPAYDYLVLRGYNRDIITRWGIGWAGEEFRALTEILTAKAGLPRAQELGLSKEVKDNRSMDFYKDRVTFPIRNGNGEIISFGGRVLTKENEQYGKYKNGPVTKLYDKSSTLFALYEAKPSILKMKYAVLVEGYTDVISLHEAGATNTIGTCGTALTKEQAIAIKKLTDTIVLIPDNDNAGRKSFQKNLPMLVGLGFRVEVLWGEEGKDPDDLAKQYLLTEEIEEA